MSVSGKAKRVTTRTLLEMKSRGEKISMLTAYDYTFASLLEEAKMEIILVGDSAANVMAGHSTTLPITLEQMIYHAESVVRAVDYPFVVVDMPFGTYEVDPIAAAENGVKIMRESGADGVKIEGGVEIIESVKTLIACGIPVMGHLGLTPQSVHQFGGYGLRAKEDGEAEKLLSDAKALEEAGCFSLVLEKVPAQLAERVAKSISIPVIGIGAGAGVDGQVLVLQDMLGLNSNFSPKFLRRYLNLHKEVVNAFTSYIADVKSGDFPSEDEQY